MKSRCTCQLLLLLCCTIVIIEHTLCVQAFSMRLASRKAFQQSSGPQPPKKVEGDSAPSIVSRPRIYRLNPILPKDVPACLSGERASRVEQDSPPSSDSSFASPAVTSGDTSMSSDADGVEGSNFKKLFLSPLSQSSSPVPKDDTPSQLEDLLEITKKGKASFSRFVPAYQQVVVKPKAGNLGPISSQITSKRPNGTDARLERMVPQPPKPQSSFVSPPSLVPPRNANRAPAPLLSKGSTTAQTLSMASLKHIPNPPLPNVDTQNSKPAAASAVNRRRLIEPVLDKENIPPTQEDQLKAAINFQNFKTKLLTQQKTMMQKMRQSQGRTRNILEKARKRIQGGHRKQQSRDGIRPKSKAGSQLAKKSVSLGKQFKVNKAKNASDSKQSSKDDLCFSPNRTLTRQRAIDRLEITPSPLGKIEEAIITTAEGERLTYAMHMELNMRKDLESEDLIQDASQQGSSNSRRCSSETTPLNLLHSSTSPKPTLYATPNQKKSKHSHLFPNRHEHLLNPHKHHIVKRLNDNEGKSIANLKESTPEAVQCVLLSPLPAPHSKLKSSQKGGESISEVSSSLLSLFSAIQPASPRMNSQNPSSLAPRNEEEILSTPARKTPSVTISFSCSPRGPLSVKENPLAQLGMGKYSVPSSLSAEGSSDSRQKEVYSVAEGLLQRPAECNVDWARRQIVQFLMQPSCRIFEKTRGVAITLHRLDILLRRCGCLLRSGEPEIDECCLDGDELSEEDAPESEVPGKWRGCHASDAVDYRGVEQVVATISQLSDTGTRVWTLKQLVVVVVINRRCQESQEFAEKIDSQRRRVALALQQNAQVLFPRSLKTSAENEDAAKTTETADDLVAVTLTDLDVMIHEARGVDSLLNRLETFATLGLGFDCVQTLVFVLMGQPPSKMPTPPKPPPGSNNQPKGKGRGRSRKLVENCQRLSSSGEGGARETEASAGDNIESFVPFRISQPQRRAPPLVVPTGYCISSQLLPTAAHCQLAQALCSPSPTTFQLLNPSNSCAGNLLAYSPFLHMTTFFTGIAGGLNAAITSSGRASVQRSDEQFDRISMLIELFQECEVQFPSLLSLFIALLTGMQAWGVLRFLDGVSYPVCSTTSSSKVKTRLPKFEANEKAFDSFGCCNLPGIPNCCPNVFKTPALKQKGLSEPTCGCHSRRMQLNWSARIGVWAMCHIQAQMNGVIMPSKQPDPKSFSTLLISPQTKWPDRKLSIQDVFELVGNIQCYNIANISLSRPSKPVVNSASPAHGCCISPFASECQLWQNMSTATSISATSSVLETCFETARESFKDTNTWIAVRGCLRCEIARLRRPPTAS